MFRPLPVPELPADAVAQVLDELRTARRELADAGRTLHMLNVDPLTPEPRGRIEAAAAERRCELWAAEVRAAAQRARALGLDVDASL